MDVAAGFGGDEARRGGLAASGRADHEDDAGGAGAIARAEPLAEGVQFLLRDHDVGLGPASGGGEGGGGYVSVSGCGAGGSGGARALRAFRY